VRSSLSASLKSPSSSTWDSSANVRPGQTHAHDGQQSHPVTLKVEVRPRITSRPTSILSTPRLFTGKQVGHANPIIECAIPTLASVRVRAYGTFDFHVGEPASVSARVPVPTTISGWTSLPTPCAHGSSV